MSAPIALRDVGLGAGCVVFALIWYGLRALSNLASTVFWCVTGVSCWCYAFNFQGQLGTREDVEDNASRPWAVAMRFCFMRRVVQLCIECTAGKLIVDSTFFSVALCRVD